MSKKKRPDIPCFGRAIFETHCHLDYLDPESLAVELEAARAVGVDRIITIAVSPDNLQTVLDIAQGDPRIWCTQGVHPHEAEKFDAAVAQRIRTGSADSTVVAIGEIGLDYFYDHADRAIQRAVFREQLAIAVEHDLPVVIHTRDADDDTQAILSDFAPQLRRGGVVHSFSSGLPLAEFCIDAGFMLGFNGMVTFNKADNVREAVALTPLNRLLLETDSPYLTPAPYRGRANGPKFLPFIAERVAAIKDIPVETLLDITYANSQRLFFPAAEGALSA